MINFISIFIITYFIILNTSYFILFLVSYFGIRNYKKRTQLNNYLMLYQSKLTPPISLLVPAYNEEGSIVKNVASFIKGFNYPEYEIIVINDGSKDDTLNVVLEEFKCELYSFPFKKDIETAKLKNIYVSSIYPNLFVLDKENGGKADALNAGINVSRYPYFGSIDADTILEPDSYLKIVAPIIENPKSVIAAGGIVGVMNGCEVERNQVKKVFFPKNWLAGFQVVEYLRAFLFGRYAWTLINALPLISGAFGIFQKKAVVNAGGYSSDSTSKSTVGEDMELIIRLHKYYIENNLDYKIEFVPDPLSWTEVPEDFNTLKNQRSRWHRGLIETIFTNKKMLFNKKYKNIGMLSFPYYFLFEFLSPFIELLGYLLFPYFYFRGMIDTNVIIVFFTVSVLLGVLISMLGVFLELITFRRYKTVGSTLKMCFFAILENFGYRQLTLIYRLRGVLQYIKQDTHWGEMKRKKQN